MSGGSGGENVWYNDLYYLDLQTLEWTKLEMEGKPPESRDYLTVCSLSNLVSTTELKYVVLYGFNVSLSLCLSVSRYIWWIQ